MNTSDEIINQVWRQVAIQVDNQVWDQINDKINLIEYRIWKRTRDQLWNPVNVCVWIQIRNRIYNSELVSGL